MPSVKPDDLTARRKANRFYPPLWEDRPKDPDDADTLFAETWNRLWPEFQEIYERMYPELWAARRENPLAISSPDVSRSVIGEWERTKTNFRFFNGYFYEFWFEVIPMHGANLSDGFMYRRWTPAAFSAEVDWRLSWNRLGRLKKIWYALGFGQS